MSIGPDGKWSGLTVNAKRRMIAMTALRRIAGLAGEQKHNGTATLLARQALKDCGRVSVQVPKEKS